MELLYRLNKCLIWAKTCPFVTFGHFSNFPLNGFGDPLRLLGIHLIFDHCENTIKIFIFFFAFCIGYVEILRSEDPLKNFKGQICLRGPGVKWSTFWPWPSWNINLPYLRPPYCTVWKLTFFLASHLTSEPCVPLKNDYFFGIFEPMWMIWHTFKQYSSTFKFWPPYNGMGSFSSLVLQNAQWCQSTILFMCLDMSKSQGIAKHLNYSRLSTSRFINLTFVHVLFCFCFVRCLSISSFRKGVPRNICQIIGIITSFNMNSELA